MNDAFELHSTLFFSGVHIDSVLSSKIEVWLPQMIMVYYVTPAGLVCYFCLN